MARKRSAKPSYCLHKASGQAVVRIQGKDYYLGRFGSERSHQRYDRLLAEWKLLGRVLPSRQPGRAPLTIEEMIEVFWLSVEREGRYWKAGDETSERGWYREALRPLRELYGPLPASEFGPRRLQALRASMIESAEERGRSLSRTTVNGRIQRVVRVFRWAVSMELLTPSVWEGLRSVSGLRRGQSNRVREPQGVRAVSEENVRAVLPFLSSVVAAMVKVQWFTGMRPGELCSMALAQVDRSEGVWVYRPSRHKAEHHGAVCERMLGPRAQRVLQPYLERLPDFPVFSHSTRVATVSEVDSAYTPASYRRAIHRACDRAEIDRWSPNQLRHARAAQVRSEFGLEGAQAVLGHARLESSQIYATQSRRLGMQVALESG